MCGSPWSSSPSPSPRCWPFAARGDLGALFESALVTGIYEEEGCPGVVSFFAPAGSFAVVAVRHAGLEPFARGFVVRGDRWETVIDVVLRPLAVPAKLVLRVRDGAGEAVPVVVTLRDLRTAGVVVGVDEGATISHVPPGDYSPKRSSITTSSSGS